jgi:hypothetical protein
MNYVSLIGFLKSVEGTEEWIIAVNVFLATEPSGLRERGKCEMQIIGAVMRKLLHLAFGVLKSGKPYDPLHSQNA